MGACRVFVHDDAEREDVRARVDAALHLLGRHVRRRSHDHSGRGDERRRLRPVGRIQPRQTEVQDLHADAVAAGSQHDVLGLEIAMDDAALMRVRECVGELARQSQHVSGGRPRAVRDRLAQRAAVDEFGGEVEFAVDFFEGVHDTDARMHEPGDDARFAAQPLPLRRVAGQRRRDGFQRH